MLAPLFVFTIVYGGWPLILWLAASFFISAYEWHNLSRRTSRFVFCMAAGSLYFLVAHASFFALREVYSLNVVLLLIGMIWFSDTAGYFTGKLMGGPKLIVKISPNKTWSGFGGALFVPGMFAMLWIIAFGLHPDFNVLPWYILYPTGFALGIFIGSIGQAGDLMISFVKRKAQVKDTGVLIPGHGGLLDRIDSMMLGAPVFFLILVALSAVLKVFYVL